MANRSRPSARHPWKRLASAAAAALLVGCAPAPRSFVAEPAYLPATVDSVATGAPQLRVAVLPFANYSPLRDAPDRVAPIVASELGSKPGVVAADAGAVQAALDQEPWLLLDRVPPDLVDRLGSALRVHALVVGSVLTYEYREGSGDKIPQVSLSVRLIECPGGRVLWSAVHSRDGDDGEWLFGFGRVHSLEQLTIETIHELFASFPDPSRAPRRDGNGRRGS